MTDFEFHFSAAELRAIPNKPISTIGSRLRDVRKSKNLSQEQFAAIGGVQKRAQINYEQDERSPDARYLSLIGRSGCDVLYILIGEHRVGDLP